MTTEDVSPRSALFVPGDRPDRYSKAIQSAADVAIIDLEDAVARSAKDEARESAIDFLRTFETKISLRINPLGTKDGQADVAALAELTESHSRVVSRLTVVVPKIESAAQVQRHAADLPGNLALVGLVETAQGIRNLDDIVASERIGQLAVGAVDLSVELGCDPDGAPITAARAAVVIASAGAGLAQPLDTPCLEFRDLEVVRAHGRRAVRDGFGGVLCIHPSQTEIINLAFTPTDDEITWAEKVVKAGDGASSVDGQMVDAPVIKRAERILARRR